MDCLFTFEQDFSSTHVSEKLVLCELKIVSLKVKSSYFF